MKRFPVPGSTFVNPTREEIQQVSLVLGLDESFFEQFFGRGRVVTYGF